MKILVALPLAMVLCAASAPPADLQTGRSVAVEKPTHHYWLSDDLNRLTLQKPASARSDEPAAR